MARKKVIIEARVNEYAMRDGNPDDPWSPEEIAVAAAACCAAGASIVHYHARREDGSPCHDLSRHAASIRAIRSRTNALVHPTIGQIAVSGGEARIAPVEAMARHGIRPHDRILPPSTWDTRGEFGCGARGRPPGAGRRPGARDARRRQVHAVNGTACFQ